MLLGRRFVLQVGWGKLTTSQSSNLAETGAECGRWYASVLLNELFEPYPSQWEFLESVQRIKVETLSSLIRDLAPEGNALGVRPILPGEQNPEAPWLLCPLRARREKKSRSRCRTRFAQSEAICSLWKRTASLVQRQEHCNLLLCRRFEFQELSQNLCNPLRDHLSFAFSPSNALNAIGQIATLSMTPISRDVKCGFSR